MTPSPAVPRRFAALLLDLLIAATGAVLLLAWITGGVLIPLGPASVSINLRCSASSAAAAWATWPEGR